MAVELSPGDWLTKLTQRMDRQHSRYRLLECYVNGDAPLPELSKDTREAWRDFQREARTNFGLLIRDAVCDRVIPAGVTVGGSVKSRAAKAAARIYRDNRMDRVIREFVEYGTTFGRAYLTVWNDDEGKSVITADSPRTMIAATDPLQPWRVRAALRIWRDLDDGMDYAVVWAGKTKQKFARECYSDAGQNVLMAQAAGGWKAITDVLDTNSEPPVVVYDNLGGMGEFEPHIDLINRINREVLNLVTTLAMQAFKQRALQIDDKTHPGLPQHDEKGNTIDWAKLFEPHPAALWNLPPGVKVWESSATDTTPMLNTIRDSVRSLSAVTKTPLPMLVPDSQNQSAAGAENTEKSFIFKCVRVINAVKLAVEAAILMGLVVEGFTNVETVCMAFEDPARVMMAEKYQAAVNARAAGQSLVTVQRTVLGMTPEEIEQDAIERAKDMPQGEDADAPDQSSAVEEADVMKAKFDALGVAVRAGVDPVDAANRLGLNGIRFTGGIPVSLRMPNEDVNGFGHAAVPQPPDESVA